MRFFVAKKETTTKDSPNLLKEVWSHYSAADQELTQRVQHKERGYDVYDKLFRSYIDPAKWPFSSRVFDPRPFAAIFGKASRLIAAPLQGRLVPRESGDELGAKIGSALLAYQWNRADRGGSMLSKVFRVDLGTRKYGGFFAFVSWRKETRLVQGKKVVREGPEYEPLNIRDVLLQPGARSISESDWVQVRRHVTIEELENVNHSSTGKPIYDPKTLEALKASAGAKTTQLSVNKQIMGLSDSVTKDDAFPKVEIITEYRKDKWITFSPQAAFKDGTPMPLRDIPNPYEHGEIPIVPLVYYPIDEDIVGMSELEPVASLFKSINAFLNLALETGTSDLYGPLLVNPVNVRLNTIDFKPKALWFMNNPMTDIKKMESSGAAINEFVNIYRVLVASAAEALGESTQGVSAITLSGDKTATEIQDLASLRSSRDNLNQLMLKDHLTKVVELWWSMNKQFIDEATVIRVAGSDAIKFFLDKGLADYTISQDGMDFIAEFMSERSDLTFEEAYDSLRLAGQLDQFATPKHAVTTNGQDATKLALDPSGDSGFLTIDPTDLKGEYDFIADVESMALPNDAQQLNGRLTLYNLIRESRLELANEGYKPKYKDLLVKIAEHAKLKDGEQFFSKVSPEEQMMIQQSMAQEQTGGAAPPSMAGGPQPNAGIQTTAANPLGG